MTVYPAPLIAPGGPSWAWRGGFGATLRGMGRDVLPNEPLQIVLDRIDGMHSSLRQGLTDELWSRIPAYVDSSQFVAALPDGGSIDVPPIFGTLEIIRSIVVVVPAGATGIVRLGSTTIPVSAGWTALSGFIKPLQQSDTRRLTITGAAGAAFLWLTGEQAPTFGVLG